MITRVPIGRTGQNSIQQDGTEQDTTEYNGSLSSSCLGSLFVSGYDLLFVCVAICGVSWGRFKGVWSASVVLGTLLGVFLKFSPV